MARRKTKAPAHALNLNLVAENLDLPLHAKVRQMLRARALEDFAHGHQFYSERELIEKLGVSQPTIRRALSDLVVEGFLVADARRGYFVRHHSETRYVGLIQPVWNQRPYGNIYSDYFLACRENDITLLPYGVHETDDAADILNMIRHQPSEERLVITGLTLELTRQLDARFEAAGYRHVLVGPRPAGYTGGSVFRDPEQEVNLILSYLLELGHRRIAFMINEPAGLVLTNRRAEVIADALKQKGLDQCSLIQCQTQLWHNSFEAAYRKTQEILRSKPWPTAIVPLSGVGSWAVLRYALEQGIKVPEELTIASFDPTINTDLLPIPITELTFSEAECARKAVEMLWLDSANPIHVQIETTLTIRQSSAPPRLRK